MSAGRLRVQVPSGPPFSRIVAQSLECPAWDREAAGENPAVPANFNLLPWSNTSGIRLLSGTMQVGILPAAPAFAGLRPGEPLPGSVKVARRPVKPFGVGASPTLAAILGRQADTSWLHLSRKQDRHRRGRSITDAFRQRPVAQEQSTRLITGRPRSITARDDHFPE